MKKSIFIFLILFASTIILGQKTVPTLTIRTAHVDRIFGTSNDSVEVKNDSLSLKDFQANTNVNVSLCRHTKKIRLSSPFDQLQIGKTKLDQVIKVLGEPTEKRTPDPIEHEGKQIMLIYNDSTRALLRLGYVIEKLFNITLDTGSCIVINNILKVGKSDTNTVLKTYGKPVDTYRLGTYPYFYYELSPYEVYFSFDKRGVLFEVSCFAKRRKKRL